MYNQHSYDQYDQDGTDNVDMTGTKQPIITNIENFLYQKTIVDTVGISNKNVFYDINFENRRDIIKWKK